MLNDPRGRLPVAADTRQTNRKGNVTHGYRRSVILGENRLPQCPVDSEDCHQPARFCSALTWHQIVDSASMREMTPASSSNECNTKDKRNAWCNQTNVSMACHAALAKFRIVISGQRFIIPQIRARCE